MLFFYIFMCNNIAVRTTIDIPSSLLKEANRYANKKTKKGLIIEVMEHFIQEKRKKELVESAGKFKLDTDLKRMRERS